MAEAAPTFRLGGLVAASGVLHDDGVIGEDKGYQEDDSVHIASFPGYRPAFVRSIQKRGNGRSVANYFHAR